MPAECTRTSIPPRCSRAAATTASGASSAARSTAQMAASAPVARTASAASSRRSAARPTSSTRPPASPSARAISAPMPELAPVTTAAAPWRSRRSVGIGVLPGSTGGGEAEVDGAGGGVGPAGGHDRRTGAEADALGAVHGRVAEEGLAPAAEREVGDGDRDGDVEADHARLDLDLEAAGGAAVPGEEGGPVAVGVGVDEGDGLVEGRGSDHREDGAEDLFLVDGHVGGDPVDDRSGEEEAGFVPFDRGVAAVDDEVGALFGGRGDEADDPVPVGGGDQRAELGVGVGAG